jgi:hypothetical protein
MNLAELRQADLATLEELFARPRPAEVPRGWFRGTYLCPCTSRAARRPQNRAAVFLLHRVLPFGVDFDSCRWTFFHRRPQVAHFVADVARSRWRETEVVAMRYQVSRLPGPVRGLLYDEVRPLSPDLCLGLGGINRKAGEGELFFFALERQP